MCYYYVAAYFVIFFTQGLFAVIYNSAAVYAVAFTSSNDLYWTDYLGIAAWLIGFLFETVGDYQLLLHLKNKDPKKKPLMMWGLWRYTRHPNYFGEAMCWWGMWLIACSLKWGWVTFYAPLGTNLGLRFLNGVYFLERKYNERGNPDWLQYKQETNCFVPWIKRKAKPDAVKACEEYYTELGVL